MRGLFGLLPTPYDENLEIHSDDLCSVADFCCRSGQHGVVWPVMVGEFYFLGEKERIGQLDRLMETIDGRLPFVFGCSGISIPQVMLFAEAGRKAKVDAIIAMAPARSGNCAEDMYRRLGDVFDGPIMIQNSDGYSPLNGDQMARLAEEVPHIEYVKEERQPGPKHISEVKKAAGSHLKGIFSGAAGKYLPDELRRGADGCMPACEFGDVLGRIIELWWQGDHTTARNLHRQLLPLINLENHSSVRYFLQRRGVISCTAERSPSGKFALDTQDKQEITELLTAIANDVRVYPFGPE